MLENVPDLAAVIGKPRGISSGSSFQSINSIQERIQSPGRPPCSRLSPHTLPGSRRRQEGGRRLGSLKLIIWIY